jgi:hypothetical protein
MQSRQELQSMEHRPHNLMARMTMMSMTLHHHQMCQM